MADYEKWAQENLRKSTWEFFIAATEDGCTYADNFAALKRFVTSDPQLLLISLINLMTM